MTLEIKQLGIQTYSETWQAMQHFTQSRRNETPDQLWLLQHPPVYTQGQAGKKEHLLKPTAIPLVQSDRGGQITYHGPGQLVAYVLMDLKRKKTGIKRLVTQLELSIIELLKAYGINASTRCGAPGVYTAEKKIASIGLRVRKNCSYHGISINVDMDLKPFKNINPCGYASLEMTQIKDFVDDVTINHVEHHYIQHFKRSLSY